MKKVLIFLFAVVLSYNISAQVGIAKTALSLEDNSFVGSLWEPKATVNYTIVDGEKLYGLVISMNTYDEYFDVFYRA